MWTSHGHGIWGQIPKDPDAKDKGIFDPWPKVVRRHQGQCGRTILRTTCGLLRNTSNLRFWKNVSTSNWISWYCFYFVFSLSLFHTHTFLVVRIHGIFAYILCDVFSLAHRARWGISITSNESRFGCMTLIWHDSTLVNACIGGNKMRNFDIGN